MSMTTMTTMGWMALIYQRGSNLKASNTRVSHYLLRCWAWLLRPRVRGDWAAAAPLAAPAAAAPLLPWAASRASALGAAWTARV
jgi:hypothetical protein